MKRTFGNFVERFLLGGTTLKDVEFDILQHLVRSLPEPMRLIVVKQFGAYNLCQREIDGRALNFYRMKKGKSNMDGLPLLDMAVEEVPLVRLTAQVSGDIEPIHATLTAVNGRVFCMALNRPVLSEGTITVTDVKQAWRSTFRMPDPARDSSASPEYY